MAEHLGSRLSALYANKFTVRVYDSGMARIEFAEQTEVDVYHTAIALTLADAASLAKLLSEQVAISYARANAVEEPTEHMDIFDNGSR